MKIAVLTTTPDDWDDLACEYGAYWTRKLLIPEILLAGFEVFDLQNQHCIKVEFDAEVKKKYSFFKGFGHGNKTQFAGFRNKILLDAAVDDFSVFDETMVHLLSCSTGATLGKKFPLTYMGYKDVYYFMAEKGTEGGGKLARPYFDSDFEYDRQVLIFNATHSEAVALCKAKYKEWYYKSDAYTRQYLLYDASIIEPSGDPNRAHPAPPPPPPPVYECPWDDFEGEAYEVQEHIRAVHCPKCPPLPDICSLYAGSCPKWLRSILRCKIP